MATHVFTALPKRRQSGTLAVILVLSSFFAAPSAFGLTEPKKTPADAGQTITDQTTPDDSGLEGDDEDAVIGVVPLPDPLVKKTAPDVPAQSDTVTEPVDPAPSNVEVLHDITKAPEPVIRLRELIVEAAASGDIERLRSLMKTSDGTTQVVIGDQPDDPVVALKELSGDAEGREILAILLDVMASGFVRVDAGTPEETYIWPYFAEKKLESLSPPEIVELLRIVTAGDMAEMKEFGGYNFYRVGITPKGEWKFFVAGD